MHLHSNFSDGKDSIEDMVDCAIKLEIKRICFTDHVWKSTNWIETYLDKLQKCQRQYENSIELISGVEAKFLDFSGEIDISESLYSKGIRIVAAMHRIPCGNGKFIRASEIKNNVADSKVKWLETLKGIQYNKHIDCLAHPFSLLNFMGISQQDDSWWESISDIIGSLPIQIEYNVKYDNQIVPNWFWKIHKSKVVPATDSHSIKELCKRSSQVRNVCEKFFL
jgi:Histidinol phosphatase and related hydrolases of the PHP family